MPLKNFSLFKSTPALLALAVVVLCCCGAVLAIAGGLGGFFLYKSQTAPQPTSLPTFALPSTATAPATETIQPVPSLTQQPPASISRPDETLSMLKKSSVPENNPADLACRLLHKCNIPASLPSGPYKTGDQQDFWVTNTDTAKTFQVSARLAYLTDVAYFWVEDGVSFNQAQAKKLVDTFSTDIVPTDREFFGSEPNPGVDEDPHIYILYARGIGSATAGYFSSSDTYHPQVKQYSNAHEMFVFNAENSPLDDEYTYGVLAHEFQHMIHFAHDRNENSWLNEGFSELAVLLNGYNTGFKDYDYSNDTDLQLTDWGGDVGSNGPHYGASFLFTAYFLDRFGEQATQALVRDPANGMDSVDSVLKTIGATDPLTSQPISADDVFMDWAVTNYLLDNSVGDGRYSYQTYQSPSYASETATFETCPAEVTDTVNQYGIDYLGFSCPGEFTLRFTGSTQTTLLPTNAYSGKMAFWSNKGDESDMTLTRTFDFSQTSGPLTLTYQTWYDLETDYDYVYVEASTDGGKNWEILKTPSGTADNPSGNSFGWGYNGQTDGWKQESIDLSRFAGQEVQIRFEYVTDAAFNGEGFLLDDLAIPEINYLATLESDEGGWQGNGFMRIENALPQTFRLALITLDDQNTTVQTLPVSADQTAEINLNIKEGEHAILVVSGMTRFTRGLGSYTVSVK